ncbi:sodium:solute symporter [candidate division KSB1 bacterium]
MEDVFSTNFGTVDWIIVIVYLAFIFIMGIVFKKYVKGLGDFIVAGRNLRLFLAIATLTGTELGLVTVMYNAELGFRGGFSAFHIGIIEAGCIAAIGVTGFIVYKLRESKVMTIPEFYGKRFGIKVRWVGGVILALSGILNMGLFLQAGSRFMIGITGVGIGSDVTKIVMSVMLIMVLIYTAMGGMVSVVILDYIQFVVLSIGMGILTFFTIKAVSWESLFSLEALKTHGSGWFNPLEQPEFGITYIIWMFLVSLSAGVLWQAVTMRVLASKSPKVAQHMFKLFTITGLARRIVPMLWGIGAFIFILNAPYLAGAFFPEAGEAVNSQFGFPIFIAKIVPSGLIGIIAAGMLAAFMSTHDSYLLSWSSVLTQDIISPLFKKGLSDKTRITVTRAGIFVIGIYLLIWGLWYEAPTSLWSYFAITGTIYFSGAFPVVVGGLYWKKASRTGAMASLLCGLFSLLGLIDWSTTEQFNWVSEKHIALITFVICAVVMVGGSLLFPDKENKIENKLTEA